MCIRDSIPDHDWAGFARALGAQGFTVREPAELASTFEKALAAGTTALIDVKADKNCPTGLRFQCRRARLVLSRIGSCSMTELDLNPATLPADARALYEKMTARRKAQGEGFGGPYLALLNHPELARRIEELGFFLKFEGALPRTVYQFIVLTVARATGADFEWHDHIAHARAAGLPADVIDCIGSSRTAALPQPYALVHAILAKTMAWQIVPDDLQVQAATQWGKRGLVEIVVLSGFYQMFAAINQGFDIRPAKSG